MYEGTPLYLLTYMHAPPPPLHTCATYTFALVLPPQPYTQDDSGLVIMMVEERLPKETLQSLLQVDCGYFVH